MSPRTPFLAASLVLLAPLAVQASDEVHARRLATSLNASMDAAARANDGSMPDRFAKTARAWAYHEDTEVVDRVRLKFVVRTVRALMKAPQAALHSEDFMRVSAQLETIIGPESAEVLAKVQQALFREMTQIFSAARDADSDPVNKRPVTFKGKTYEWVLFEGRPILAEQGATLPAERPDSVDNGAPTSLRTDNPRERFEGSRPQSVPAGHRSTPRPAGAYAVADGPGGEKLDIAMHSDVDQRNLSGLEPSFREKVVRILRRLQAKGWQPRVGSGRRTLEEQKEKVRKGYSKTLKSWHLKGLAADIIDSRWGWGGEAANLDHDFWTDLGEAAKREGLTWGGSWKSFRDVAHVQDDGKNQPTHPPAPRTLPRGNLR